MSKSFTFLTNILFHIIITMKKNDMIEEAKRVELASLITVNK